MVTFKCKRSGNTVSFTNENDIAGLRKHEGYSEVKEEQNAEIERKDADGERANVPERSSVSNDAKTEVLIPEFTKVIQRGRPKKH